MNSDGCLDTREEVCLLKHKELRMAVMSDDQRTVSVLLEALGNERENIVNMSPGGANTLLYLACQAGHEALANILLSAGADGRLHPVTKYSPLYAAVHHGHIEITKLILQKFPELVQQTTVERWLPLHAACINGYIEIVELLINYNYPEELYKVYRDEKGVWEWKLPFDPNQQDVTGQTSLYIASILGNKSLVNLLLSWRVKCHKVTEQHTRTTHIQTQQRVSHGIENIISKLNLSLDLSNDKYTSEKCPVFLNVLCGAARETALLAAVRGGFTDVVILLLEKRADPNVMAKPVEDQNDPKCSEEIYGLSRTPLFEACKQKSVRMVEILLKYGAKDEQSTALAVSLANKDELIVSQLLSRKVYPDCDYKINKTFRKTDFLLPSSSSSMSQGKFYPNVATIINWHNNDNIQLSYIKTNWMVDAVLHLNPKLQKHPKIHEIALTAITRIDLSNNNLSNIPPEVFSLISLRYLNIAQNKLQNIVIKNSTMTTKNQSVFHTSSVLEEIYIQDNRLITISPEIFHFSSLIILDISNNKLQEIPFDMWKAPKLRELNIAFNLLKDLPIFSVQKNTVLNECADFQKKLTKRRYENDTYQGNTRYSSHSLLHRNIWSSSIEVTSNDIRCDESKQESGVSQLNYINVANNLFTSIPAALPCLAVNLTRLNMSYNNLRSMGHVTSYPATLKQLDLSHNEITCWPSLPRISDSDPYLRCYAKDVDALDENDVDSQNLSKTVKHNKNSSFRSDILKTVCRHRKHLRLESLKTLILADNLLSRIQLSTDDAASLNESDDSDWRVVGITKSKLIFPNLSMLDISNNCLKEIPAALHELTSLSVLNISGNIDVTNLPPQLGQLSRLWNLNTRGCLLQEPLHSMIKSKKYKTMDIIGYLKSIYEDAKPYSRMKLMVVGVQGIGKTTLLELLKNDSGQKTRTTMDHWTKRVGHKNVGRKSQKLTNISTVGVDIGTWICDKRKKDGSYFGPVVFRTWDFGGQKEYYATHQYFLSKRSLYLVLWRIIDGHKGLSEVLQWLGNIQTRAPNSPVIIVGTHYDAIEESFPLSNAIELQRYIREKFIAIPDAEKIGLPRVIDSIEVSCRTLHNIQLLSNVIYDTVFGLKCAGSKDPLLLQKVPASYIALEDVVNAIANNLKSKQLDPVLNTENYKKLVAEEMRLHHHRNFRDWAELSQATMFLHDNGIMLHYDDATLRDFYFLDPQWLCDMLAHVVTVKEVNPFVKNGIMKLEDLQLLFKYDYSTDSNKSYILHLLNKFEVALTWDSRTLLIPSLLSASKDINPSYIRISTRTKNRELTPSTEYKDDFLNLYFEAHGDTDPIRRVILITYFPSGFWSRLTTRILGDEQILECIFSMYILRNENNQNLNLKFLLKECIQWKLWQTGISLCLNNIAIIQIWEVPFNAKSVLRNSAIKYKLKIDGIWTNIDIPSSSILEISLNLKNILVTRNLPGQENLTLLQPNFQTFSKFLALIVDHIDLLLEDWYPALGTRFVHTSEGRFLVTRLVLCPECIRKYREYGFSQRNSKSNRNYSSYSRSFIEIGNNLNLSASNSDMTNERNSQDSLSLKLFDLNSDIGSDSSQSQNLSTDDKSSRSSTSADVNTICYTWMIENCILSVYNQSKVICPSHFEVDIYKIAPDIIFADIPEKYVINSEYIIKGALLGRGAFGFVFKAKYKMNKSDFPISVAMKMLQPVPLGSSAKESAVMAYKIALGKWDKDPLQHSCKAYCTARQELAILLTIQHPNVVEFIGLCIKPLALILELAPMGGLDLILRQYRRSGAHIGYNAFQSLSLQVARALEYLHRKRIVYRDLKSENVLTWEFPPENSEDNRKFNVHVKLADYGISRTIAPSGSKGFAGTEGFMAPEIIKYNGEEEYTEKIDCFSFGMFLYEIITLRQPFEGQESIKECLLEGIRPALTPKESCFPSYCLDLMTLCWDEDPKKRPSASQIVSILSASEIMHLMDVIVAPSSEQIDCGIFKFQVQTEDEIPSYELWLPCYNSKVDILEISLQAGFTNYHSLVSDFIPAIFAKSKENKSQKINLVCCCLVENYVWIGDCVGNLHVFDSQSFSHIFSYMFEPSVEDPIVSLIYLKKITRVSVGLSSGRLFLVSPSNFPSNYVSAEGSFVLTEFFSRQLLFCCCAIWENDKYELWCGGDSGILNIYTVKDSGVFDHLSIRHFEDKSFKRKIVVYKLCSSSDFIFSCLRPGFTIFQWKLSSKTVQNKLDCSKLFPCSESISIEEQFNFTECQISAIVAYNNEIYIGTTWGCIIVAELIHLRPIMVFRPFEEEIRAIIPIEDARGEIPLVATIGKKYRSLLSRYIKDEKIFIKNIDESKNTANIMDLTILNDHVHCILWRTKNWA